MDADHPWFIRRYVPTAIPGLLLFAGVATGAAVAWRGWPKTVGRLVAAGLAIGCVAWPLVASWPLRAVTWQSGARDGVERLCAQFALGSVAVLAADERVGLTVLPAVRTYCEVEVVAIRPDLLGASAAPVVVEVADAVARRPDPAAVEVVAPTRQVLISVAPGAVNVREVVILQTSQVGTTIGQRPRDVGDRRIVVWVGTVLPPIS